MNIIDILSDEFGITENQAKSLLMDCYILNNKPKYIIIFSEEEK